MRRSSRKARVPANALAKAAPMAGRGRPAFVESLTHRARMLGRADGPVAVVVDLDVARTPPGNRKVRVKHEADRGAQAGRPRREGPSGVIQSMARIC